MLYSDDTLPADGPPRSLPAIAKKSRRRRLTEPEEPVELTPGEKGWGLYIIEDLEKQGYHVFLRSDGRQIILSHENGLSPEMRDIVTRYRKEISQVIIDRLYQGED